MDAQWKFLLRKSDMAKNYSELLGDWVQQRESATKRDKNLVAFLAVRDDVREALDAGYAVKTIWANLHEHKRVAFGYHTFLRYVKRHMGSPLMEPAASAIAQSGARPATEQGRQAPASAGKSLKPMAKAPDAVTGFTFNSAPDEKDLI